MKAYFSLFFFVPSLLISTTYGQAVPATPPPGEVVHLEEFVVTAGPVPRVQAEIVQPTSVLSEQRLRDQRQATLGETLAGEPGVSSTYFGPGSSRPVIRGLGGDRIRILENGVGTLDASNVSPDHAVAIEPLQVRKVEVIKGPATLLYGSSAVGGVINVLDNRIPEELPEVKLRGEVEGLFRSVSDEKTGNFSLSGAAGQTAWQISGLRRASGDIRIPGFARSARLRDDDDHDDDHDDEDEAHGFLPNSAVRTSSGSVGVAHFWERGFVGVAFSGLNSVYGVPVHFDLHEDDDDHDHDHSDEHDEDVRIDLRQRRADIRGAVNQPFANFRELRFRLGVSDYRHEELEEDDVITTFDTDGYEGRLELLNEPIAGWAGALGLQSIGTKLATRGDEAFLPPSRTNNHALFVFQERRSGDWNLQAGGRYEGQRVRPLEPGLESRRFNGISASAGVVRLFGGDYSLGLNVSHSERLPTAQELYSDGPHLGTGIFEIGDPDLSREKSLGIDLTARKRTGFLTGAVSLFNNRFTNFIFLQPTGEEDHGLEVFEYAGRSARFTGGEIEMEFHLHESEQRQLDLRLQGDIVRARDRISADPLPRIPPSSASIGLFWRDRKLSWDIQARHHASQNRLADHETPTQGYTLLNAGLSYRLGTAGARWTLFARGTNLTNREARHHVSPLKELAPLPGRDFTVGIRSSF